MITNRTTTPMLLAALLGGVVALTANVATSAPAEAHRGGRIWCSNYYDSKLRWCGVRNGRHGCFTGGYLRICR